MVLALSVALPRVLIGVEMISRSMEVKQDQNVLPQGNIIPNGINNGGIMGVNNMIIIVSMSCQVESVGHQSLGIPSR